jgi:RNA polymerase sigma-70 factor (ECF subfamily)
MTAVEYCDGRSQASIQESRGAGRDVQALVERAQRGDGEAFAELYDRFAPEIYRFFLRRLGGHRETAEDLTAEVFLKIFTRLDRYEYRGWPFSAWLYRIARNHLTDHLRVRSDRVVGPLESAPDIAEQRSESALDRSLDRQVLTCALAQLTSEQRQVLTLRFMNDFTTFQIAAAMGKSESAVKKLQSRGLVQLGRIIGDGPGAAGAVTRN